MRHPDLPEFKKEIMNRYLGKLTGFLESKGLIDGKEFATTIQNESFLIPRYYIHIFDNDKKRKHQLVIVFNPIMMKIEYGVATKNPLKTIYKRVLENLRYKISEGEELEFIDSHKEKVEAAFFEIKTIFKELSENDKFLKQKARNNE